jgi:hypothetical protein
MAKIDVGTKVFASGQDGRYEVLAIEDGQAKLKMLANSKETGEPVEINHIIDVPLSSLTILPEGVIAVKVKIWEAFGHVEIKEERGVALEDIKLYFTTDGRNFTVVVSWGFDQDYSSRKSRVDLTQLAPTLRASKSGKVFVGEKTGIVAQ